MTPRQIDLIRTSWSAVEPISDAAARLFYDRLFESDPAIKRLFAKTDMQAQRGILMQTLTLLVSSLDDFERVVPVLDLEIVLEQVDDGQVRGRSAVRHRPALEGEPASATVGMSGIVSARVVLVTARIRILPASICGRAMA